MTTPALYLTAPLDFAERGDDSKPKKFSGLAYSGGAIASWGQPFVVDLASTTVNPRMPLLFQHDQSRMIGVVASSDNNGQSINVAGELFSDIDDTAKSVAEKANRGAPYQMSIGLFDISVEDVPSGKTVAVNGSEHSGPISIMRSGTVREVSIVALGADAETNSHFFAATSSRQSTGDQFMATDPNPTKAELAELQAQVDDLTAKLAAAEAKAVAAEAELAADRAAARKLAVEQLFADIGREWTDANAAPYLEMSADAFAVIAADVRSRKPAPPANLFQETATGTPGADSTPQAAKLSAVGIYNKRRSA